MTDTILQGAHVLLLEDNAIINIGTVDVLEEMGIRVSACLDLPDCSSAIAQGLPDAAILDVNIRGTTSYELAERLHGAGVPIIFLTGDASHAETGPWKDFRHCVKPCSSDRL